MEKNSEIENVENNCQTYPFFYLDSITSTNLFRKVVTTLNRNVATNRNVVTPKSGHNISNPLLGQKCCGHFTFKGL